MKRAPAGQALVEWAVVAMVLLVFALGLVAVGQIVGEYTAVRSAANQAAFAAARAPSADAAVRAGEEAAREAVRGSQVEAFAIHVEVGSFVRGSVLTTRAEGYVNLGAFPIVTQILGNRFPLQWEASALIEPYRSRTP